MTDQDNKLEKLRIFITDPDNSYYRWELVADRLSECFAGEPELWAREARWVTAALDERWGYRPIPITWNERVAAHTHLLHLTNDLTDGAYSAEALGAVKLSHITSLSLVGPVTREAFAALWANPTLRKLKTLKLAETGMCDAWLPDLLASDVVWTSLRSLTMREPRIKTAGAELLAASARMKQLTTLVLKGCILGPAGRKALGASPYMSDKLKARNKAAAIVSNEEAEAAPPAPSDVFGDARSWVQRVDEVGWERLCDLLDRLHHSPQQDQLNQELLPYLESSLSRWPDALRIAPLAWTDALMDGKTAPRVISLARGVRMDGLNITIARAKALVAGAAERGLAPTALAVRGTTLSGKALRALWPLCGQLESLELDGADQGDALYEALRDDAAPTGLTRLRVLNQGAPILAIAPVIHRLPALRALHLSGSKLLSSEGWSALFEAPCIAQLRELELGAWMLTREVPNHEALALERLSLSQTYSPPYNSDENRSRDALVRWLERSPRLHTLELGDHWGLTGDRIEATLPPTLAPGLRSLRLCAQGVADDGAARRWVASRAGTLERLVIRDTYASRMTGGDPSNIFARSMLHAALTEGAALRELSCELGVNGLGLRGWALDRRRDGARLESLKLAGGGESGAAAWLVSSLELPALRALQLTSTHLTGEVVDSLVSAPCWQRLTTLELRHAYSAPGQLDRLMAALPPRLEALVVERPSTTAQPDDYGLRTLISSQPVGDQELAALPATLKRLALVGCGLHGGQLPALLKTLDRLEALEELDLSQSPELRDADIIALLEHPRVAQLHRLQLRLHKPKFAMTQAIAASPRLHLEAKTYVLSS
jgi:hypothetical protein